jgi:hypothetical protein
MCSDPIECHCHSVRILTLSLQNNFEIPPSDLVKQGNLKENFDEFILDLRVQSAPHGLVEPTAMYGYPLEAFLVYILRGIAP